MPLRRSHEKKHHGCVMCKKRKIKCDQYLPSCLNCIRYRCPCSFASSENMAATIMTTTNDVARTVSRQPIDKLFMFHNELSIHPDWPWEQRRALAVFRSKVSNQVSGHFDRAFWNTVALQAAHQEKPVKYAILALSGLVEHVQAEGSPNDISSRVVEEGAFALQNYNEAIRELTSSAQNGCLKIDVCLITCLLFVSFEVVRQRLGAALLHIRNGLNILTEAQQLSRDTFKFSNLRNSSTPYLALRDLEILFSKSSTHGMQLAGVVPTGLPQARTFGDRGPELDIPPRFASLEEAHDSIHYHSDQCMLLNFEMTRNPRFEHAAELRKYLKVLDRWEASFQSFLSGAQSAMTPADQQAVRSLELNFQIFYLQLDIVTKQNPPGKAAAGNGLTDKRTMNVLMWDDHTPRFQKIVDSARNAVDSAVLLTSTSNNNVYTSDESVVPVLFAIIRLCRHPAVRRETVSLLYKLPPQKGLWDNFITARVCDNLIALEEKDLGNVATCRDIPAWARIDLLQAYFDEEGHSSAVKCFRQRNPNVCSGQEISDEYVLWNA